MAEREVAGEAEQDVEAECEDGPDHDLGRERLVAVEPDDPLRHRQYDDGKDGADATIRAGDQSRLGPAGRLPLSDDVTGDVAHSNVPFLPTRRGGRDGER